MGAYTEDAADALAAIREAGTAVTFTTRTTGTLDEATDQVSGGATATVTGFAIRTKGKPLTYEKLGLVMSEAPTLLVAPDTYGAKVPLGASVVWGGLPYTVRDVDPVDPDGQGAVVARVIVSR